MLLVPVGGTARDNFSKGRKGGGKRERERYMRVSGGFAFCVCM